MLSKVVLSQRAINDAADFMLEMTEHPSSPGLARPGFVSRRCLVLPRRFVPFRLLQWRTVLTALTGRPRCDPFDVAAVLDALAVGRLTRFHAYREYAATPARPYARAGWEGRCSMFRYKRV
jgi:hypothetical protein